MSNARQQCARLWRQTIHVVYTQEVPESTVAVSDYLDKTCQWLNASHRQQRRRRRRTPDRAAISPPLCGTCMTWSHQMLTELTTWPKLGIVSLRHRSAGYNNPTIWNKKVSYQHDAFSGQSRPPNRVQFHMLGMVSYRVKVREGHWKCHHSIESRSTTSYWCSIVTMALYRVIAETFMSKNIATLKSQSKANQGHWKCEHGAIRSTGYCFLCAY